MIQHSHQEVVTLIKSGKRAEARMLLVNHLKTNQNDAAAWWLLAKAAPSKDIARQALQEVQRLNPTNARVEQALTKLGAPESNEAPAITLADLLSDAANRLLPDEPQEAIEFDEIDDIDNWVAEEEKQKRESLEAKQRQHPPANDPLLKYMVSFTIVLLGFVFIVGAIQRLALPVSNVNRCVTAESNAPSASINHAADSSITLPEDLTQQTELTFNSYARIYLNNAHDKHGFTFTGATAQQVTITVSALDYGMNPLMEVYDPNGQQLAFCDDYATDNSGAQLQLRLPSDGQYTIVVYQPVSDVAGRFEVDLRRN
jgi:hypothetical protein